MRRGAGVAAVAAAAVLAALLGLAGAAPPAQAADLAAEAPADSAALQAAADTVALSPEDSLALAARQDSLARAAADSANPFVKAPRDTTGAPMHYTTSYNINRYIATWNQVLNVDTRWKSLHIDNATNVTFREDTQRHQRTGTRTQSVQVNYERPHGPVVGLALDLERDNDGPVVNGRQQTTSSFSTTSARLTLADSLYLSETNFMRLQVEGGRVGRDETGAAQRSSSGNDLAEKFEWSFLPTGPFKLQLTGSNSNSLTDAQGQQQGVGSEGRDTTYFASTRNRNRDLNLGAQARFSVPWHELLWTLGVTHGDTRQQQPTLGRQETLTQKTDAVTGHLEMKLGTRLSLKFDPTTSQNVVVSDVDSSRNYDNRGHGLQASLDYSHPTVGTVNVTLGDRISTNDSRKRLSGNLQDLIEHSLTASLNRGLLKNRFQLQLNMSATLNTTRYDSSNFGWRLNQDYLNRRVGGSLSYAFSKVVRMVIQGSEVLTHYVFLDATKSGRNTTDRLYSVQYDITYAPAAPLKVTQSYIVSADASLYDFEDYPGIQVDNRYTKTTSYVTNLHHTLGSRTFLDATNNLRLTRTGSYNLDPLSGTRVFSESGSGQDNDLSVKVSYKISKWISGVAGTRGEFIHQDNPDANGNRIPSSRQSILEFNAGMSVNYPFSETAKLNGTFTRTARSDSYTSYTSGVAGKSRVLNQDYFLITASFDLVFR
ncbi:MAG TPA: hypothetical protein VMS93_01725 [Candidatus Saccharimonadales bacterium]|nr:hypothetical protein [Candidatus Saccharimonadales bacterium]